MSWFFWWGGGGGWGGTVTSINGDPGPNKRLIELERFAWAEKN